MDPNSIKTMAAAAGAGGDESVYVEDVFSTFSYKGNNGTQSINNGIDLDGEGGLVWVKNRDSQHYDWQLADSGRGNEYYLRCDRSLPQNSGNTAITSFNNNGFSLGNAYNFNANNFNYASWTFRKAKGFFDVVTWTGDGSNPRNIAHNIGSVPGCIILRRTDDTADWIVYHRSSGTDGSGSQNFLKLNENDDAFGDSGMFPSSPTSTQFTVSTDFNASGGSATYVAYIFAHDDPQFGEDEDESIIKCGSFTAGGSGTTTVTLGWEPQYILLKRYDSAGDWMIIDTMRGWTTEGRNVEQLVPNNALASYTTSSSSTYIGVNHDGFHTSSVGFTLGDYIYVAIRRGPMKPAEAGTDVFKTIQYSGSSAAATRSTDILVDMIISQRTNGGTPYFLDRLRAHGQEYTDISGAGPNTGIQTTSITDMANDSLEMGAGAVVNYTGNTYNLQLFKRAPGFFDIVTYVGNGSNRNISHSLGAVPGMIIVKNLEDGENWACFHTVLGEDGSIQFSEHHAASEWSVFWNSTMPTSSVFTVGTYDGTNKNNKRYMAYLFATLPGVSKVGSYTGTGNDINIDCGFTGGARFVMIKRHDGTGDWYIWDTVRGIVAGNDPYLFINTNAAEVTNTDYIDPLNAGFTVTSSAPNALNESSGGYIYLAIA